MITEKLATTLDRHGISDRAAMMVVGETAKSLGHDLTYIALNRSSVHQQRHHRKNVAESIRVNFDQTVPLIIHWDGKLRKDNEKVDPLTVLVSGQGVSQLLAVPKIASGTGKNQAQTVADTIQQ